MSDITHTTTTASAGWAPDVVTVGVGDALPALLAPTITTVAGRVEGDSPAVRVLYVADDDAQIVAEGEGIDLADPALGETVVTTAKVAQLTRISRELHAQRGTAGLLGDSMRRAVTAKADALLLRGDSEASIVGLLGTAGVLTLDDSAEVEDNLDGLIDLLAAVEANGAQTSHIVMDPVAWSRLRKLKVVSGSNSSLLGAGTSDAEKYLLGVPVVTTAAMPEGEGLIVDKSAVVSAVGDVQVATSTDAYFASDSIGVRVTLRLGAKAVRPNRLAKFSVADPNGEG